MSEDKEKNNENKSSNNTKEVIFETTYEKVLFIINKVKDFIKSIKDKETSKLEEELDWVIKVITNRDLYTYELVKDQLMKQDEGYDKFINFVKKYNEAWKIVFKGDSLEKPCEVKYLDVNKNEIALGSTKKAVYIKLVFNFGANIDPVLVEMLNEQLAEFSSDGKAHVNANGNVLLELTMDLKR